MLKPRSGAVPAAALPTASISGQGEKGLSSPVAWLIPGQGLG